MKTIKLKSDLLNKFSEYLKGTNPKEFHKIIEIQVKYQNEQELRFQEMKLQADISNLKVEMLQTGFEIEELEGKSLKELQKMLEDLKKEIEENKDLT